jgi:hypothetical protein
MPEPEEVMLDPRSTVFSAFSKAFARQNSQFEKGKYSSFVLPFGESLPFGTAAAAAATTTTITALEKYFCYIYFIPPT